MSHLNFASRAPRMCAARAGLAAAVTIAATILATGASSAAPDGAPTLPTPTATPPPPPTTPPPPPTAPDASTRTAAEPTGTVPLVEGQIVTIAAGKDLPVDEPLRVVVTDREAWVALWGRLFPETSPAKPMPVVDFAKDMVLVASSGRKPTTGYRVTIRGSDVKDGRLVVAVEVGSPRPDMVTAQQLTHAYHIVRHARFGGPVVFEDHAPPARK